MQRKKMQKVIKWQIDEVKESIGDLRKAEGHFNEAIISYCDYGSKCETGLMAFLERILADMNILIEADDKHAVKSFFDSNGGINYYSIKEYLLKTYDNLYTDFGTFSDVLAKKFPLPPTFGSMDMNLIKTDKITIDISITSAKGYTFIEELLMNTVFGEEFKEKNGIILERVYLEEIKTSDNVLDILKGLVKKVETFQIERGTTVC